MAITFPESADVENDIADINTTPLVDVMLVLLIIFLIAIPVIHTSVSVRLPRQTNPVHPPAADTVLISVDSRGAVFWHDSRVPDPAALRERLQQAAQLQPQPTVHIRGDLRAEFDTIAQVLQASQAAGIARVGFVTEPQPGE